MYKQSPSRNYRSKGIKVKHILQICVLLAVCFWLIYQVKHSHDKKKEFDEKGVKIRPETQSDDVIRFGRKDLPRVEEVTSEERTHEDDEEGNEVEEEENKHEMDENKEEDEEHESEEDRIEEKEEEEDQSRGGGDDEIDEHEQEKTEGESEGEHGEEIIDEEQEREGETDEKSGENKEGGMEDHAGEENESEARDHDAAGRNTHEAREENYKADDASSEVAHDTQTMIPETGNVTIEHGNYDSEQNTSRQDIAENKSDLEVKAEVSEDGSSLNATSVEEKTFEAKLNKTEESSIQNSTVPIGLMDKPEDRKNETAVLGSKDSVHFVSNGTLVASVAQNATINSTSSDASSNSQVNPLESDSASDKSQAYTSSRSNNTDSAITSTVASLHAFGDTKLMESDKVGSSDVGAERENSGNLKKDDKDHEKNSENNGGGEAEENSGIHSMNENGNSDSHDPIDASDSNLTQEGRDSRTDLDTLPEITTQAHATEDAAAE